MKRLIIALAVVVLMAGFAFADQTGRGEYTTPWDPMTNWLNDNEHFYHSHEYDGIDDMLGIGVDVKLWSFDEVPVLDNISAEGRYDFNNDISAGFIVLGIDLTDLWSDGGID